MPKENSVIQIYATATQDNAASIDVPDDGLLLSSSLIVEGVLNADTEEVLASLEFGATPARNTNDSRTVLNVAHAKIGLLTSGAATNIAQSTVLYGDGIKVFGGERLYLHTEAVGGTLQSARALLVFNFASFVARRR